jgi:hemophore-related protein
MTRAVHVTARAVFGAVGASAIIGAAVLAASPAFADPLPPNCTAADLAQVTTGVSAATTVYLFSHPEVNAFLTDLESSPRDTVRAQVADYMAANPQVKAELAGLRQPLVDMRSRCGGIADDES